VSGIEDVAASKRFAFRIAGFNSVLFLLVIWTDCQVFALKPEGVFLPCASFGAWAYLVCAAVFAGNVLLLPRSRSGWLPLLYSATWGLGVAVIGFKWPGQHMHQMVAFGTFPVPGLIATRVRRAEPLDSRMLANESIPFELRLERIKQELHLWTTLTISGGGAFLAFTYFWLSYMSDLAEVGFSEKGHQVHAKGLYSMQVVVLGAYFMLGPIYEGFLKIRGMNTLLLHTLNGGNNGDRHP